MSERCPVIEIVDYQNGLSWKFDPSWCKHYIDQYGSLEGFKEACHEQLRRALVQVERTLKNLGDL